MARGRPAGMRVIAGSARGVTLLGPRSQHTRPTTARLRESLFGILESAGDDMSEILDLYAGTGALGIEALSRGGGRCTFVEMDRRACRLIRENLRRTRLAGRGTVVRARVGRWQPQDGDAYTLVLADPPYDNDATWREIEYSVNGALAAKAVVVVEHATIHAPPAALLGHSMWRNRHQGEGAIAIYRSAWTSAQRKGAQ